MSGGVNEIKLWINAGTTEQDVGQVKEALGTLKALVFEREKK